MDSLQRLADEQAVARAAERAAAERERIEKEILRTSLEISTLQEAERIEDLKETVVGRASRSQQQLEERLRASWRRLCGTWRVEGTHGKTHQGSAPPPEQSRLDAAIKANRPLGSRQRTGNSTSGRRRGAWALRFTKRSYGCGWTSGAGVWGSCRARGTTTTTDTVRNRSTTAHSSPYKTTLPGCVAPVLGSGHRSVPERWALRCPQA